MPYYEITYGGHTWTIYRVFAKNARQLGTIKRQIEEGEISDELIVKEDGGSFEIESAELSDDQTTPVFGQS